MFFSVILVILTLAGCATAPLPAPTVMPQSTGVLHHTVKGGDTLYGISKLYGVELDNLVRANSLDDASAIKKGQALIIPRGRTAKAHNYSYISEKDTFTWPVRGRIVSSFGAKLGKVNNKGIDIAAEDGASVRASRAGRVVYCDSRHKGFGKTVILDHGDRYQTVYSHNSDILVKVGDAVAQHDVIARVGRTGRAKLPMLHFEIRKNGEAQNPHYYLPQEG